jgi:hypothetical protein
MFTKTEQPQVNPLLFFIARDTGRLAPGVRGFP